MHKKLTGNSRLFFIEFLIVLFFFLIISTICLKLFVQAHKITVDSENLSRAQNLAASAAELLLAGYDVDETIAICQEQADAFCIQIVEVSNSEAYTNATADTTSDTTANPTADTTSDTIANPAADTTSDTIANPTADMDSAPSYMQYLITICQEDGTSLYHLPLSVFPSYRRSSYAEAAAEPSFAKTEVQP